MIKWLIIILVAVPRIIYSELILLYMNKHKDKYSLNKRYEIVRKTAILVAKLTRRKYRIINENIITNKHENGRIYVSNHFNVFEAVALIELSKTPLIFISKKEVLKVPFLKTHAIAIDTLFIDRKDVRQSLRICKEAGKLAKSGMDVAIFAEGTRSKDGNVAEFKAALPTIIHYGECETVLICMHHSQLPLKFRWISYPKEHMNLKFFEPLPYDFYLNNRKNFNELTRNIIQEQLELFRKEYGR